MTSRTTLGALWVRGLWVFLMLVIVNLVVGAVAPGPFYLLLPSSMKQTVALPFVLGLLTIGLPFMGWLFEVFASPLGRLRVPGGGSDSPV
jgi:hypothetical protein